MFTWGHGGTIWSGGKGHNQLIKSIYLVVGVHHKEWGGLGGAGGWEDGSQSAD